jgi:hypothetical protein
MRGTVGKMGTELSMKYMILFEFCQKHQLTLEMLKFSHIQDILSKTDLEKLSVINTYDFITHGRILSNSLVVSHLKALADSPDMPLNLLQDFQRVLSVKITPLI